jgi:filamentous hemagglutinin family protein
MPYWRGKSILHLSVRWVMLGAALHFAFYANPLLANPTGASVVNGAVNMQTTGNTLAITASDRSIINWQGFSIGAGETTQFIQPSANASVLNRVTSGDASQIMGALQANGQVYLINPNGVFIGNGATINVGSFLASTANVSDESFMRGGNLTFSEASGAGIINRGTITANQGNVFLLAKTVDNSGTIQAAQGTVGLMAGTQFFLKKDETGAVKVKVDSSSVLGVKAGTGVANSGVIEAMQAQLEAQGNVYALAINQSGIIRATGVSRDASGTIVLSAPGGMIRNTGTMLALNRDGSGGRLSVSGGDIMTDVSSIMTAAGTGVSDLAMGGQIEISAEKDAILSGRLDVSAGDGAKGGRLVVTGERVGLFDGKVNASGGTGGGEVLLGGDYQGLNPLVRNASQTYVGQEAEIRADATVAGDGGKIITWSDNGTQFYGSATAKGGAVSGNGGLVEVSGRDFLDYLGSVNTLAPNGVNGALLLDPTDMAITTTADANTTGTGTSVNPFAPLASSSSGSTLTWATINTALGGGNVFVTTSESPNTTGQTGTITIGASSSWNSANSLTFTAASGGNIVVDGLLSNATTGGLVLITSGAGQINLNANITLAGGNLTLNGSTILTTAGAGVTLTTSNGSINLGAINSTAATQKNLTLVAGTGAITFSDAVGASTALGAIAVTSAANTLFTGGVNATSLIYAASTGTAQFEGVQTFSGALTVIANSGINYATGSSASVGGATALTSSTGNIILNGAITTTGGTTGVTATAGSVTIGQAISSSGAVAISGNTGVTTTAGITSTAGNIGITATTGTLSLGGAAITSVSNVGAGTVTLAASAGALTILAAGDITSGGNVSLTGSTGIVTAGDVSTTGDNVTYSSATTLNGSVGVNTVSGGTVAFSSTLGSNNESNLTLTTGTGNINFVGAVGGAAGVNRLGDISIVSATDVSFSSTLFANAFNQTAGAGTTTFTGASNFDGNVSVSAGILSLVGSMTTLNGGTVTIGSTAGNNGITGNIVADGAVSVSATGGVINLDGNITTTADLITLNSSTVLLGDQTLTSAGGNININNIINGGQILTLNAGAGNVTFASAAIIGGTTGLTGLEVTGTTINLNSTTLTVDGGAGGNTITFTGATVLGANVTIDTDGTSDNNVNFAGTVNADNATTQNRTLTVTSGTGTATFGGILGASGALADLDVTAATINLNTTGITVNDQGGNTATFTGAAVLGANVTINTDGAVDNNVNFTSTINADNATTQNRTLTVTAGTGTATFGGIVGATQALADMDVSAGTINLNANVTVDDQGGNTVIFTGATVLGGNVAIDTDGTTDNNLSFAGAGTINSASSATPRNLTFNSGTGGTINVAGAVGTTGLLGTVTITQSGGATFNGAMTANTVAITDSAAGADVAFLGNLTANTAMTVAAGTAAYDVLITGTSNSIAGSSLFSNTGQLTIGDSANDVSLFTGGLTATTQSSGFGAGFLRSAGGNINLGSVTFTADSTIDATNNGAVPLGADVNLATALGGLNLTLVGGINGIVFVGGATVANLTVTADEINFSGAASITATGAVLLQGATAATTIGVGGGAGTLDLNDTDLAAIADGATSIMIGQAGQTGLVTVDTSTFRDPVTIRSSGTLGEVQVDGLISATGATTSVTLEGATLDLNAGIDTAGGAVTLTGGIGGVDLAAAQTIDTAAGSNSGTDSGDVSITATGTGTITLAGDLLTTGASNNAGVGSAGGAITITGSNGNVSITSNISALGGASSAGAGGAGGDLSITTTTGTIGLANIDTSGGDSSLNNSNGGDAGAIAINSSGGLSVTLNSSTISASGGAAGGGTGLAGDGANITFDNPVILAGDSTISTTGNTGGDIAFNDTVSGAFDLNLATGNGDITFLDDVGSGVLDPLGIVTVNSVDTFLSTADFEADEFVLATTSPLTGVTFSGGLNLSIGLSTIAGNYGFSITGAANTIAGTTTFSNTGTLILGDGGDTINFTGGVVAIAPSAKTINGTITAAGTGLINLGTTPVTVSGNSTVGGTSTGAITLGNATLADNVTLTVGAGAVTPISLGTVSGTAGGIASNLTINTTGAVTAAGVINTDIGTITITQSGGVAFQGAVTANTVSVLDSTAASSVSFQQNLTVNTGMSAAAGTAAYNVSILGTGTSVINGSSTFANNGTLTLGAGGTSIIQFTGGVTTVSGANGPSVILAANQVTALGTGAITLGSVANAKTVQVNNTVTMGGAGTGAITVGNATLADGVTLTVGTGIANAITLGTVTGTAAGTVSNLTLNTTGVVTVGGAIGTDIGTVTLINSGGATFAGSIDAAAIIVTASSAGSTVDFQGSVGTTDSPTLNIGSGAYNVSITGANNTIAGITTFNNTGVLTLGNGGDTLAFTGGVIATAPSGKTINGNITAAGTGVINLGTTPVTVSGNSTVGGTSTGAITLGSATLADSVTLTLGTGIANAINLGSVSGTAVGTASNLTFNTTGAVTVAGAVNTDIGTITITQSGGVAFQSTVTANTVTISDSTAGADVAFQGNLTVNTGMSAVGGTAAYDILITGSSNSIASTTTFSNTGQLTIGNAANDVTVFTGGLTATTQSAGFGAGFVRTAGGVVDLGAVTFTAATTIDTTNNGAVPAGANLTLVDALGGQNITLIGGTGGTVDLAAATVANLTVTANAIDFSGAANSIVASGDVLLQGATAATTIGVGGGAGTLQVDDNDLLAIADGATSITIGQASQTGLITVDTSTFRDSVTIRSSGTGGEVQVDGLITATGATTSVTLQGATLDLNAGITTAGGAVTLTGGAGGVDLAAAQTILTTAAAGTASGAVAVTATGAGTINLAGAITTTGADNNLGAGSAGGNVTITGATGTVTVSGAVTATGGAGTRAFVAGGENGGAGGDIAISATTGNVSVTGAVNTLGGSATNGEGGMGGDLALSTTTGTIGLGNINTSGGTSTTTNFDGGDAGTITLSSTGSSAVTLNNSTISASGGTAGGGIGVAGNGAAITFNNPVLLATGAASIITTGANGGNITFNSTVNSSSSLTPRSLTLTAGSGAQAGTVTFAGIVGGTAALTDLDVTAKIIQLNTTSISVDAGAGGNIVGLTGAVTLGANVSLDLDGALGNNDLLVTGTVDSASSLVARNLTVLAGASNDGILTLGDVTVTGAVGGIAPLGNITVSGAGTLTSGTTVADNVSFTGDLTATANEMFFNGTEVRSTGAGTITFAPTTAGRGILVTGTATVDATRLVLDTLDSIYTAGRLVIGSATSGAVTVVGALDLSGTGYTGFSLLSQNAVATFNVNSVLTLPTATDIRFQLGTGNVDGTAELNSASLSPNLVSAGGTLRFVSVGSVSLYGSVANLQTSVSSGVGGGLVYLNEGTLNVIGSQTAAGQMLIGSENGDLNLSAQLTGTKITSYAAQNFNNTFGSTAINLLGGRGLVYSTSPDDNTPNSANGGLNGFGAAYLVPTPDFDFTGVGTYTIANAPAGSANLMAYSDPLPVSQLDAVTLNQIVQTEAYLAAVPLTGASLPALPRSEVRLGFRAGAPQQRAPALNSLGKVEQGADTKGQSAEMATPGRLKVSQVKRAGEDKGAGQTVRSEQKVQPIIRIGAVTLRPSGDYLPAELAEVTMDGIKISQK